MRSLIQRSLLTPLTILTLAWMVWPGVAAESTNGVAPAAQGLAIHELTRTDAVDFEKEILPMLRGSCLACHNRTKAKADLVLETPADILKGGESGPGLVPNKSQESLMFKLASHRDKPIMPPKDNKVEAANLSPEQLGLLRLWIDQGAVGVVSGSQTVEWQAMPAGVNSILSLALTQDGQWAAAGRANQIALYHLPTYRMTERLTDPELIREGLYSKPGMAHRDLVNSIAFSPDGNWLASGDYRMVRLWHRQASTQRTELQSLILGPTTALAVSKDGRWFGTGHSDGKIGLWASNTGLLKTQWVAHAHAVQQLRFSASGGKLATLSGSVRVGVWDLSASQSAIFITCPSPSTAVAWLTDDTALATAGADQVIRIWSLPNLESTNAVLMKELKGHEGRIQSLEMSAGAHPLLISGSADGTVRWWNLQTGELVRKVEHGGSVTALVVSQNGERIASAGSNSLVRIWNSSDGKSLWEFKGDRFAEDTVTSSERDLSFSKSEVGYRQGILEEARKREKTESDFALKVSDNRVAAEKALTEKQKAVLTAVETRAAAEKAPAELSAELQKVNADRDAAEAAAGRAEGEAASARQRVEQAKAAADQASQSIAALTRAIESDATKSPLFSEVRAAAEKLAKLAAALAEDSKKVADRFTQDAAPKRKAADDAKTSAEKSVAEITEKQKKVPERLAAAVKEVEKLEKETETALVAKKSAEDQLVAAQRAARKATDAVPEAQKTLQAAQEHQKRVESELEIAKKTASQAQRPVLALAFDESDGTLVTVGAASRVQRWATETGIGLITQIETNGPLTQVSLGPQGTLAFLGSNGITTLLRRSEKWELVRRVGSLEGPSPLSGRINALEFSPNGKLLAVGSGEPSRSGELSLLDVATGQWTRNFTNAHSDVVLSVDFSSDNTLLASSASDRFVKVWDLASGTMVKSFEGHTHHVMGVSWKRDGRTLASAGADKVVKLWNFVTGEQRRTIGGAEKELTSIRYVDATGEWLVASGDSQIRLIAEDGKTVRSFGGAKDFIQAACITSDGRWVLGGGTDSVLRLWNGKDGALLKSFEP